MSISIYQLKPRFQQLLRPLIGALHRTGITPNGVTLGAMALSVAYGAALALVPTPGLWFGLPLFLLVRMALNAIDGMLATATGNKTTLGALLNEICDQVSDVALYLPFALAAGLSAPLVVGVVVVGLLAEFSGVLAQAIGAPRGFAGPMGKSDRAFAFGLIALLYGVAVAPVWCNGLLGLALLLSALTVFNRLRRALRSSSPATP